MLRKLYGIIFLPYVYSFLFPIPSIRTNIISHAKIYTNEQQNDYLNSLENKNKSNETKKFPLNEVNKELQNKSKREANNTRKMIVKQKKSYIESLIIPIFEFEDEDSELDGEMPLEIPLEIKIPITEEYTPRRNRQQRSQEKRIISSTDGTFQLENIDSSFNFTQVGGYKEVKEELTQVLDFLLNPTNYTQYGIRIPKGLLLEGPPGNGKTLLAKGLAGEANTSFISTCGSIFNEKYVGVGSARVRELFNFASNHLPCIIFIDELDAVARSRHSSGEGSDAERDQTLNQLLVAMDGFDKSGSLLVIGATNRADILDKAILRPGRFDKIITVPNPDQETRNEIIKIHLVGKPINTNITEIVKLTKGFSGAQIENIINEAVLLAIRNNSLPVTLDTFELLKDRVLFGQTTKRKELTAPALKRIAIHETGHLLLGLTSPFLEKPEKVSIETTSSTSLGYTMFEINEKDEGLYLREYLEDKLKVLLGGRVAEEIFYGLSVSSGAISDLESAFAMAKSMIMNYGMGNKIIYPYFSEQYKREIDDEIHYLINSAYKEAKRLLELNKPLVTVLATELYNKKVLSYQEICDIVLKNTTVPFLKQ